MASESSSSKRAREEHEATSGLTGEVVDLTNRIMDLDLLVTSLRERNRLRIQLLKKNAEIQSRMNRLQGFPPAKAMVDTLEKEWRKAEQEHHAALESIAKPLKKKARVASDADPEEP